ncbi:MAG: 6,7-dimethyl-8-ribityllumazine synthase [Zavarzinella sp.]
MMSSHVFEGSLVASSGKYAIVAARFNSNIVDLLLAGALHGLSRHGVADSDIETFRVPGSFEIPTIANALVKKQRYKAIICLGAVIRGETDHYDYVSSAATNGIAHLTKDSGIPVIYGVLTCDTLEQALNRAGGKSGNKGYEAAVTAIEMANLLAQIKDLI